VSTGLALATLRALGAGLAACWEALLELAGFRAFSLSAAKDEIDIRAMMHAGKQRLMKRRVTKRFSGVKAVLSMPKINQNLASVIETPDSVHK
jgi:hypothetical protein